MANLYISPPDVRPHGYWYVSGPRGFGMSPDNLLQAYMRYLLKGDN